MNKVDSTRCRRLKNDYLRRLGRMMVSRARVALNDPAKPSLAAVDEHGNTPPHLAAAAGTYPATALRFFLSLNADIEATNDLGLTPLHLAALNGQDEAVRKLINAAVERNIKKEDYVNATGKDGRTPMHWAARIDAARVVDQLIDNGGDVNAVAEGYGTPLDVAVNCNAYAVEKVINKAIARQQRKHAAGVPEPNDNHAQDAQQNRKTGPRQQGD